MLSKLALKLDDVELIPIVERKQREYGKTRKRKKSPQVKGVASLSMASRREDRWKTQRPR